MLSAARYALLSRASIIACPRTRMSTRPSPGTQMGPGDSWTVEKVESIAELELEAVQLVHKRSGAAFTHFIADDVVNAFSVNFKTTPMDSTGISHILEHVSLCGSRKFPVRDPFFKMLNRSLSTFMNAMTGPDYTLYPFSTPNERDYYNLMSVYLDAVFRPNLNKNDFRQEGWRLEPEDLTAPNSRPIIKGVVFNEMKGVYADPQQLFGRQLLNAILPSHTYGNCSGGIPEKIVDLTWEALRNFHSQHYSPHNARFFTYGNLPLEPHLEFVDQYLPKENAKSFKVPEVPGERRWSSPRSVEITCAPDPSNPTGSTIAVAYAMADINDFYEVFVLGIIGELLTGGPNAPFYKSLLESGMGQNFAPSTGYDSDTKDTLFAIGLQGVDAKQKESILSAITSTFQQVVEEGFEEQRIESVLHSTELSLKNRGTNFGLNVIMALTPVANHSPDFLQCLRINENVERFRKDMAANSNYLQDKVKKYFVDNQHRVVLHMSPDENYTKQQSDHLEKVRERLVGNLSKEQEQRLYDDGKELEALQNLKEDLSCLPSLKVTDIAATLPKYAVEKKLSDRVPLQISRQPTNGVAFFRALLGIQDVPQDLRDVLPLFTSILSSMGAGKFNFRELDTQIDLTTGGLGSSIHLVEQPHECNSLTEAIAISSHCLGRNIDRMLDLWTAIFNDIHMTDENADRLKTLLRMSATNSMNRVVHMGHSYAMGSSAASLQPGAASREAYGGLVGLRRLQEMAKMEDVTQLLEKMRSLSRIALTKERMKIALNASEDLEKGLVTSTARFIDSVSGQPSSLEVSQREFTPTDRKQFFATPFPVNYCSISVPIVPYTHEDFPALRILARLLSTKFLHQEIREKGGAYGGGATASGAGTFSFYSYRDPNSARTLETFERSAEWVRQASISQQDLDEAKLGVFQKVDEPTPAGSRGLREFLANVDDATFEEHRRRLKETTEDEVRRVAEKYLANSNSPKGMTVIGPADKKEVDDSWTVQELV